jgi:hypothetical protein
MSLEHSPSRQKKTARPFAAPFPQPTLEPLYTRREVAERYRHTAHWVTRNYRRLDLKHDTGSSCCSRTANWSTSTAPP